MSVKFLFLNTAKYDTYEINKLINYFVNPKQMHFKVEMPVWHMSTIEEMKTILNQTQKNQYRYDLSE